MMSAYNHGLVTEEDIDAAVTHLMMLRMRLGMFDKHTKYDDIPYEANYCAEHHKLDLKAAEESMILLKNDGILPLNKEKLKAVAVIGPNSDSEELLKGNYNGTATKKYTLLEGIRAVLSKETRIFYSEGNANNSYAGADKVDLNFPESQTRLLTAVCETARP